MKKFFLLAVATLLTAFSFAQSVQIDDTGATDFDAAVQASFANFNTNGVTTNKLMNRSPAFINIEDYDGSRLTDSMAMDFDKFTALYLMASAAALSPSYQLPNPSTAYNNYGASTGTNRLFLLTQRYNWINPDAFTQGTVSLSNNQYFSNTTSASRFVEDTLFAASTERTVQIGLQGSFQLTADKVFNNWGTTISNLTIDWGDGLGNCSYTIGSTVTINYPSLGVKSIIISCNAPNGKILKTRIDLEVRLQNIPIDLRGAGDYDPANSDAFLMTSEKSYLGASNNTRVEIFYACGDKKLRKPLIIVDGFEPQKFNSVTANEVLKMLDFNKTPSSITTDVHTIGSDFKTEGYDLVVVDLNYFDAAKGRDYIQRNAYLLESIIKELNRRKREGVVGSVVEKNVIIGFSMGGLVAKYALLDMEQSNPNAADGGHDVKTFIPFDSPLKGANITLGLQHAVKHLLNYKILGSPLKVFVPSKAFTEEVLTSPASRQLLTYQAYANNQGSPAEFVSFQTEINGMGISGNGKLLKCSQKAVSSGSMIGIKQFEPGVKMFEGYGSIYQLLGAASWTRYVPGGGITMLIKALPEANTSALIYDGKIDIKLAHLLLFKFPLLGNFVNVPSRRLSFAINLKPLDSSPGGRTELGADKLKFLTVYQPSSCFIPAVSALDLRTPASDNVLYPVSNVQQLLSQNITTVEGYDGARSQDKDAGAERFKVTTDKDGNLFERFTVTSGPDNQDHTALSYRNTGFLLFELTTKSTLAKLQNGLLDSRTYNFGLNINSVYVAPEPGQLVPREVRNIIDYDLNVTNTGRLWVNRLGRIDFTDITTNPLNTSNSTYVLNIQKGLGCTSSQGQVSVSNGGEFRIGDASPNPSNAATVNVWQNAQIVLNNNGQMVVEYGSTTKVLNGGNLTINSGGNLRLDDGGKIVLAGGVMTINNGGTLNINSTSQLIIENGGRLIIEAGATVQLWDGQDPNGRAKIVIKEGGELVVNGDINLSGNGYFQFDFGHILTLNSDLRLKGYSKTHRLIQMSDPGSAIGLSRVNTLRIEGGRSLYLTDCKVELLGKSQVWVRGLNGVGSAVIDNVTFSGQGGEAALIAEAAAVVNIKNSIFENAARAFKGLNLISMGSLGRTLSGYKISQTDFNNCGTGIELDNPANIEFRVNHKTILNHNVTFNVVASNFNANGTAISARHVPHLYVVGSKIHGVLDNNQWAAMKGITLENVPHCQLEDETLIENCQIGVDGVGKINNNIFLRNKTEIKKCQIGIAFNGGIAADNEYSALNFPDNVFLDFGLVHMDCAKLTNNQTGVQGQDVLLEVDEIHNSNGVRANVFSREQATNLIFDICYVRRYYAVFNSIGIKGNIWNNVNTNTTDYYRIAYRYPAQATFTCQNPAWLVSMSPWPIQTNLNLANSCLYPPVIVRGEPTVMRVNGVDRNTSAQYDAAYLAFQQGNLSLAATLFAPLANVDSTDYAATSDSNRQLINMARIFAPYTDNTVGLRSSEKGQWVEGSFVQRNTRTTESNELTVFPNPAHNIIEVVFDKGSYHLRVSNTIGQIVYSQNTEGSKTIDVSHWQAGVYLIEVLNQNTKQQQHAKVIVQH